MSDQFLSEIRIFGGSYVPAGWANCDGGSLPVAQNSTLYSLIGLTYGGDGRSSFNLPNLQGRAPLSFGRGLSLSQRNQGETGGERTVSLQTGQTPSHTHGLAAGLRQAEPVSNPSEATFLTSITDRTQGNAYASGNPGLAQMSAQALQPAGNGSPHNNMQPYLGLLFGIALQGQFPNRP